MRTRDPRTVQMRWPRSCEFESARCAMLQPRRLGPLMLTISPPSRHANHHFFPQRSLRRPLPFPPGATATAWRPNLLSESLRSMCAVAKSHRRYSAAATRLPLVCGHGPQPVLAPFPRALQRSASSVHAHTSSATTAHIISRRSQAHRCARRDRCPPRMRT